MIYRTLFPALLGTLFAVGCTITSTGTPTPDGGLTTPIGTDDGGMVVPDTGTAADGGGAVGCNFGEPNNTREQSTTVAVNTPYTGVCVAGAGDDADFFEVTAPNDAAGGYIEVQLTNIGAMGLTDVSVYASSDNDRVVNSYTTTQGASVYAWFTVTPGAKYRVETQAFGGGTEMFTYDMNLKYTAIDDAFEPNNKREDAKPITVGTPIKASAAGSSIKGVLVAGDDDDWYKITLAAGTATVKVTGVPSDHLCDVVLYDATNQSVGESYSTTPGADCTLAATSLVAGDYTIVQRRFGGPLDHGKDGQAVPDSVTKQYTLTVAQP